VIVIEMEIIPKMAQAIMQAADGVTPFSA